MGKIYNQRRQLSARRMLRNNSTKEEHLLWLELKGDQLGYRFRRQYGVGPYIIDFYCPKRRLAIEIDGGAHRTDEGISYDKERDNYLQNHGIKTVRFSNEQVLSNLEKVVETICRELDESTSP